MPHRRNQRISGKVTDVFGHRFVLATASGKVLADIGPEASGLVTVNVDDSVEIEGEEKPTEIKVRSISIGGGKSVETHPAPKHAGKEHDHRPPFSAEDARRVAEKMGFRIVGPLTPHKKHYEATAEHRGSKHEVHVHRDHIMKKFDVRDA